MITRAQFLALLEPKLRNVWNDSLPAWATLYTRFVNVGSSKKAQETDYMLTGLGSMVSIPEGENVTYGDPLGGNQKVYTHATNGLGYKITDEMIRHELYGQMVKMEKSLLASAMDKQETDAASILNNAFSTSYAGFVSGESLCSTSHSRLDGGTANANRPSTDISLGVTALQNAIIAYLGWKNDRGRPVRSTPKLLIIHPNDVMTARELLGSTLKPGTTNNEINALREDNLTYMVNPYLTDTNAWFLQGTEHDLNFIWDLRPELSTETDFDSKVVKRMVRQGYSFGYGAWFGMYGSSGTT